MMIDKAGKMKLGSSLAALALMATLTVSGTVYADEQGDKKSFEETGEVSADLVNKYKEIAQTIDTYIEGGRQGSSRIMQQAFHPGANIYGFVDGQLVGGPIQKLFDLVDSRPPAGEIAYNIAGLEAMQDVAMVRVDIDDWAGAKYCDMFTLVKSDGQWLITSKVSHKF